MFECAGPAGGACGSGADPVHSGRGLPVRHPPIARANRPRRPVACASPPPYEINPFFFSGLYGVPSRHFFPYPHLMTAARPWLGTPRFLRAPACYSPRRYPAGTLTLPVRRSLGLGESDCIVSNGSHPSVTSHQRPVAGRGAPSASRLPCREPRPGRDRFFLCASLRPSAPLRYLLWPSSSPVIGARISGGARLLRPDFSVGNPDSIGTHHSSLITVVPPSSFFPCTYKLRRVPARSMFFCFNQLQTSGEGGDMPLQKPKVWRFGLHCWKLEAGCHRLEAGSMTDAPLELR